MSKPRVGVQLIVYGERAESDLPGVLSEVAAAGYAGFEGGLPADQKEVQQVQAALAKTGLAFTGGHASLEQLEDLAGLKARLGHIKALGGRYLISSGGGETLDDYLRAAKTLNQAGQLCQAEGMTLCYHNHHWEFAKFGATPAIHTMISATDPKLVKLCPDVYWVHVGGEKPAEFAARYQDRCPYFHFKDGLGGDQDRDFRELGRGKVDLPAALQAALACNPDWIVVEQDTTQLTPAESCRISREYLRSLGL